MQAITTFHNILGGFFRFDGKYFRETTMKTNEQNRKHSMLPSSCEEYHQYSIRNKKDNPFILSNIMFSVLFICFLKCDVSKAVVVCPFFGHIINVLIKSGLRF